ncbi:MAG: winged helix-turn-helix transcriptional regulator [Pseudonocardiaceae bacterium]
MGSREEVMIVDDEEFLRDLYDLLHLFDDKWVSPIVVTLTDGPMRRVEILSTIRSYSVGQEWSGKSIVLHDSILARVLKKMTAEGLLIRDEKPKGFPPKVYYSLTPEVVESLTALAPLVAWSRAHREIIEQAQAYSRHHGERKATPTGIPDLVGGDVDPDDDMAAVGDLEAR